MEDSEKKFRQKLIKYIKIYQKANKTDTSKNIEEVMNKITSKELLLLSNNFLETNKKHQESLKKKGGKRKTNKRKVTKKRKNKTRKKQKGGNLFLDVITHPSLTHVVIAVGAYLIGHYLAISQPISCPESFPSDPPPPCLCPDDPFPYSI